MTTLRLSGNSEADTLLSESPLALLIGMVLDQQIPLEWAFAGPAELKRRLGGRLEAKKIATMDPEVLAAAFSARPALHRYPGSMATRVQELCRVVADEYAGKAERVWTEAGSGADLIARIRRLPGFGEQKAKIFVALVGKQLGVRPEGWREVSAPYGEAHVHRSVADITDAESLARVRAFKQELKARNKAQSADKAAGDKAAGDKAAGDKAAGRKASGAAGRVTGRAAGGKPVAARKVPTARGRGAGHKAGERQAGKRQAIGSRSATGR
jgi:uncharacterized HhH-GPD family protein